MAPRFLSRLMRIAPLQARPIRSEFTSARRACAGFTLIELVTVIVLLGTLMAIALPRMFNRSIFDQRGYATEVASAIRNAQKIAVASGCPVLVTITAANYNAMQRNSGAATCATAGAWNLPVLRGDNTNLAGTAPDDVVLAPATQFMFDSAGAIPGGAPPVLTIGPFTIAVDASSGAVMVTP